MKKLLLILGLLVLGVAPALAGVNLRQESDGTACWESGLSGQCVPTGEHTFVIPFADIATAATRYISIPFAGRLKEANVVIDGTISGATEIIEFYISSPASAGCVAGGCGTFNQFTPVTPAIAEAATGLYELIIPLAYAASGQRSTVDWPSITNTSLNFSANDIIAIHSLGNSTSGIADDAVITIIVH